MEGTHGQLRSGLANRLCSDDADRFADIDRRTTTEVATVTLGTQTVTGFAGQRGTRLDFVDTQLIDQITMILADQRSLLDDRLLRIRMHYVGSRDATEDTLAQGFDDLTAFDQRLHRDPITGSTIVLDHHQVLRYVNQSPCQITRVGGFQCRVREPLACTVGRDEVLQDVQALTEIGGDRRFNDRSVRFGHQAAHARQLANLRR
ncbi:MAG: hypothetical protein AW09_001871 [Candidatus Accumulibacter phosphatis]|uniref:Uncharacterized protein n=1 Tax=Candidatus Accumulibacter phosphatis TaxID=327160 RepID=A0A080LYC7_9PROT|nr:MAG: hypothetical protein AW09_001871 [Candidatus Accumulibacter phosphatis]